MDGCMRAHTRNANMNNCLKEGRVLLHFNRNPRLQSQLPCHHLWLIPQSLPSSSLHFSLCRISIAYKKITEWHYVFHPSSPLLQFLPSHTEESCQSFSAFHLPQRFCPYFFCANFQSLSHVITPLCAPLFPLATQTRIKFLHLWIPQMLWTTVWMCRVKRGNIFPMTFFFCTISFPALKLHHVNQQSFFFPDKSSLDPLQPTFHLSNPPRAALFLATASWSKLRTSFLTIIFTDIAKVVTFLTFEWLLWMTSTTTTPKFA